MFEHFTFGAQAQTSYTQQDEVSACPTDISCIPTQPTSMSCPLLETTPTNLAMSDLLDKLTQQTLVPEEMETSTLYTDTLMCPAFEDAYAEDIQLAYVSSRRGLTKLQSRPSMSPSSSPSTSPRSSWGQPCRRLQRQLNTQLQSCTNHVKDITNLVEDMIASNAQCNVYQAPTTILNSPPPSASSSAPSTSSPPPSEPASPFSATESDSPNLVDEAPLTPPEDEGFSELDDAQIVDLLIAQREEAIEADDAEPDYEATSLRAAGFPSGIRRSCVLRYGIYRSYSSGKTIDLNDTVTNEYMPREEGRGKIRCLPRMRVRKKLDGKGKEREKSGRSSFPGTS